MRASLHTLGCRLNQSETAVLADQLRTQGYELVEYGRPTDLFVLNTCSVTEQAEADCRSFIRRTLKHSPAAFVAVTGCYAQTGMEVLRRLPGVDLIVGGQFKMDLPRYLPPPSRLVKRPSSDLLHTKTIDRQDFTVDGVGEYTTTRANLKVQDGCNFMCSFCLIPFARGHERSRDLDDILREARALAARGHKELVLTGVNIGRYDARGRTLLTVIRKLEEIGPVERIRISSIEPTTIPDELIDLMRSSSKLCRHLHIPLQSGNDRILQAMNRRYTVSEYRSFITKAVDRIPDLGLGTDLMVGFPGETEADFQASLALVEDLPLSYLHIFGFSSRPGTVAARLPIRLPSKFSNLRSRTLAELSRVKRLAFSQRFVGRRVSVLFEGQADGLWTGWTGHYVRVGVPSHENLRNHLREVLVTGVMDGLAVGELC